MELPDDRGELSCPFRCGCGDVGCAGVIRGFKYASWDLRERLRPWLSPFLATRVPGCAATGRAPRGLTSLSSQTPRFIGRARPAHLAV
jgi:hypothetical protein